MGINAGIVPEKWGGDSFNLNASQFMNISGSLMHSQADFQKTKNTVSKRRNAPVCVQTVARAADEWFKSCLAKILLQNEPEKN